MTKKTLNIPTYSKSMISLSSSATTKISLWRFIIEPFKILCVNWQLFFLSAVPSAILLTISSLIFKRSAFCNANNDLSIISQQCSENVLNFYGNMFFYFIILFLFAIKWYQFAIQKSSFSLKKLFLLNKGQAKAIAIMCLFSLINISPLFALIILFMREPNPIWQQELIFFTSVAWIFLLPLIAVRFYSLVAFALENKKCPSIKSIWNKTAGNMLKLLLGTAVIVFLALCVFMHYYSSIQAVTTEISLVAIITTEFEYNILMTLFTILCINYCYTQKELFFEGEENEQ